MKRVYWLLLALAVASVPRPALAKDFCMDLGPTSGPDVIELIFKAFTVPPKGVCKSVVEVVPSIDGLVSTGAACTTTDGTTLIFTLADGFGQNLETIQGALTLAGGMGSVDDCAAPNGAATSCLSDTLTVVTCPKLPPPIKAPLPGSLISRGPLLAR
jgi:hypothetical protein